MFDIETLRGLVTGRSREELATIAAYVLAPGLVVALAGAGVYAPGVGVDFAMPAAISELQTEIDAHGAIEDKRGVALVLEPVEAEYQIPLTGATSMWLSLDQDLVRANAGRLFLTDRGLHGRSPLIGVRDPVTVVVQGIPGKDVLIPGGSERMEDWRLQSRRALSLVSSTLLACVFAFGMSIANGLPSLKVAEEAAGKKRTQPDED